MDTQERIAVICFFGLFSILCFFALLFIHKSADKLFKELDVLEERANNAKSVDEIVLIYSELYAVYQKSFNKRIGQRVQVVFTILKTKTSLFTQQQNS
jgi:hypothetical protein